MNIYFNWLIRFSILNFVIIICLVGYLESRSVGNSTFKNPDVAASIVVSPSPTLVQVKKTKAKIKVAAQKTTTSGSPTPKTLSLEEQLPAHNSQSDCWIKINGRIYAISSYFGKHPGGNSTLSKYCGSDASFGFNTKDSIPAKLHSAAAQLILQRYLLQ